MQFPKEKFAFLAIGLLVGTFSGAMFERHSAIQDNTASILSQFHPIREQNNDYKFINPLLAYDLADSKDLGEFKPLENQLNDIIDQAKSKDETSQVSVYYRSGIGHWVGINENDQYDPASLMKIVIMIAYYKEAEADTSLLNKQIQYTAQTQQLVVSANEFDSPSGLKLGQSYSVNDLISKMIIDSDNGAAFALLGNIDSNYLNDVYTDLGLKAPNDNGNYTISAKDYSLFFRILFNATYISRDLSEKALGLLSRASFKDGLVAGVPSGTTVAHKFGEHVVGTNGTISEIQLHDCGFVYAKKQYLLCVMTKGTNVDDLKRVVKDISAAVYDSAQRTN